LFGDIRSSNVGQGGGRQHRNKTGTRATWPPIVAMDEHGDGEINAEAELGQALARGDALRSTSPARSSSPTGAARS